MSVSAAGCGFTGTGLLLCAAAAWAAWLNGEPELMASSLMAQEPCWGHVQGAVGACEGRDGGSEPFEATFASKVSRSEDVRVVLWLYKYGAVGAMVWTHAERRR
jgi:hypothetical protein